MLTEIAFLLSNPEQHLCCYRNGEIFIEPVVIADDLRGLQKPVTPIEADADARAVLLPY